MSQNSMCKWENWGVGVHKVEADMGVMSERHWGENILSNYVHCNTTDGVQYMETSNLFSDRWLDKEDAVLYTMAYPSAIRKDERLAIATTWILRISYRVNCQIEKVKNHMISPICGI